VGPVRASLTVAAWTALAPALQAGESCAPPDEGNAPLRRAVARVKYLPETEAWARQQARSGATVQYVLSLDDPKRVGGRCYWTLEVRADGKLWKRYRVSPDAKHAIERAP
jgi:hypothetical protein